MVVRAELFRFNGFVCQTRMHYYFASMAQNKNIPPQATQHFKPKRKWWQTVVDALTLRGRATDVDLHTDASPAEAERISEKDKETLTAPSKVKTNVKDGLKYVWIPPGKFTMGCSAGDSRCFPNEKPSQEVTITDGFWLGQTQVTRAAYARVMGNNQSDCSDPNLPVEEVNWGEAQAFCKAIGGRLPTEAEWEYAARAGTTGALYGTLNDIAWHSGNSGGSAHEVATKKANQWGLYDMLGNVWEWTADWYDVPCSGPSGSADETPTFGLPTTADRDKYTAFIKTVEKFHESMGLPWPPARTMRGGAYYGDPRNCRVSMRQGLDPEGHTSTVGFRCVLE